MTLDPGQDLPAIIRSYALLDGLLHSGKAQAKAVISKLLGSHPQLRARAREVGPLAASEVGRVNALTPAQQRAELEGLAPELVPSEQMGKAEAKPAELPPLEGAEQGQVVMRFAPGPSGPLHLGHSRAVVLNDEYCRRYQGTFILRLEDTNPAAVDPAAYDYIREDVEWLGVRVGREVIQSERLDTYYAWARRLLEGGHGYVCQCPAQAWRKAKVASRPCPHREAPPEAQLELWDRMLAGAFDEGQATVAVKTDLTHPNPALRDFVALRLSDTEHPLKPGARVWPVMNFAVAVDDHELGLTHVLRGKDHLNNTLRQAYLFDYFGWPKPHYTHYGFVQIPQVELKTTIIKRGLADKTYQGWDDLRLGTLQALRRRGYQPEALRAFWVEVGTGEVEFTLSWENLNAHNKGLVDPVARRLFFVPEPEWFTFEISGAPRTSSQAADTDPAHATPAAAPDRAAAPTAAADTEPSTRPLALRKKAPWHPDRPEWGFREETVVRNARLALPAADVQRLVDDGPRAPTVEAALAALAGVAAQAAPTANPDRAAAAASATSAAHADTAEATALDPSASRAGLSRSGSLPSPLAACPPKAPLVRLKNLCNVAMDGPRLLFAGTKPLKGLPLPQPLPQPVPVLQWVCGHVPLTVAYPDGTVVEGVVEPAGAGATASAGARTGAEAKVKARTEAEARAGASAEARAEAEEGLRGRVVQLERFGFVRLEGEGRAAWLHK